MTRVFNNDASGFDKSSVGILVVEVTKVTLTSPFGILTLGCPVSNGFWLTSPETDCGVGVLDRRPSTYSFLRSDVGVAVPRMSEVGVVTLFTSEIGMGLPRISEFDVGLPLTSEVGVAPLLISITGVVRPLKSDVGVGPLLTSKVLPLISEVGVTLPLLSDAGVKNLIGDVPCLVSGVGVLLLALGDGDRP